MPLDDDDVGSPVTVLPGKWAARPFMQVWPPTDGEQVLAGALHEWAPPRPPPSDTDITASNWRPEDYDTLGALHAAELGLELIEDDDFGVDYPEDQWH